MSKRRFRAAAMPAAEIQMSTVPCKPLCRLACLLLLAVLLADGFVGAKANDKLTVGVLKFGTVNWQLRTVKTTASIWLQGLI